MEMRLKKKLRTETNKYKIEQKINSELALYPLSRSYGKKTPLDFSSHLHPFGKEDPSEDEENEDRLIL
ncbi:unnamed protein product [Pleuronectes platessa]|uniref:Uncharacterized protein n=1 Tax=Pleuronectes platessa TaxID=8262 RepID=A0A9N7TP41_PLEPL|nr:unnamed protein product [Pleuronectes platessa]